ncbi:hypothetical protein [Cecembia rubra]|uniref:hypothetical protein n=1 Tax=Cecembia rubra TaxID=1485585 RepID=UPI0011B201EA|nr:hypothetical protein [Cecembia rubra]
MNQFPEITPEVINDWVENNLPPHNEIIKNHSQKTRVDLEPKYRFYIMKELGMIDPKGIFFNDKLSLNERADLLSKVLGYNSRDCKDLLNRKTEFDPKKKSEIDDFLSELKKKRKM